MNKPNSEIKLVLEGIVERIKFFRHQKGMSMSTLADKAGFTKGYMSQIENLKREPTIGTIVSIAHALGVDVFSILNGQTTIEDNESIAIVKAKDRREAKIEGLPDTYKMESINYSKKDRLIDGYILTSGFEFAEEPTSHEGQELLFILEGRQEFICNGKTYFLEKGDCCCFDATLPHYGRSIGNKKSKALVVFPLPQKE